MDMKKIFSKKWPLSVKLGAIVVVVVVPIIVVMLIFVPFIARKNAKDYSKIYFLQEDFVKEDIALVVRKMEKDAEFLFYFSVLLPEELDKASGEVFEVLNSNRGKEKHLAQINQKTNDILALAMLVNTLDFPEKFYDDPKKYPMLSRALKSFLYEEFKLSVMGLCYKSIYDKNFRFRWDENSRSAAIKLNRVVLRLNQENRLEDWRKSF